MRKHRTTWLKTTDEELARLVAKSNSMAQVLQGLGLALSGGSHSHYSKRIKRIGLDTSHFTGQAHNKGRVSLTRRKPEEVLVRSSSKEKGSTLARSLVGIGRPQECEGLDTKCPVSLEWNGKPIKLHVDHIDGDTYNNLRENLRFLCPNCHSQTPTYCRQLKFRTRR